MLKQHLKSFFSHLLPKNRIFGKINYFFPVNRKSNRTNLTSHLQLFLKILIGCCLYINATQFTESLLKIYIFTKLHNFLDFVCPLFLFVLKNTTYIQPCHKEEITGRVC